MVTAHRYEPPEVPADIDQRVIIHGVTWTSYEVMLALRGEAPAPRMYYLQGALELMSPSRSHEEIKKLIARLVEAYAMETGLVLEAAGSMTMRNAPREKGAEPDECYSIGGKKERPDLAIEVNWTSGGLDKLEIYRGLGIRELWFWENKIITVQLLRGEAYERSDRSEVLPGIDLTLVAQLILRSPTQTEAVRQFLASLREPPDRAP